MPTVETMRGPIDTAELGRTLMHEHVFVLTTEIQQNYETDFDPEIEVPRAIERLRESLREEGFVTMRLPEDSDPVILEEWAPAPSMWGRE